MTLVEILEDAALALDEVTAWMDDTALPVLGDDCDGGNMLCEGLKIKAWEIREAIKSEKLLTRNAK